MFFLYKCYSLLLFRWTLHLNFVMLPFLHRWQLQPWSSTFSLILSQSWLFSVLNFYNIPDILYMTEMIQSIWHSVMSLKIPCKKAKKKCQKLILQLQNHFKATLWSSEPFYTYIAITAGSWYKASSHQAGRARGSSVVLRQYMHVWITTYIKL